MAAAPLRSLDTSRRAVALGVPWLFLVVFLLIYANFLWPRMLSGSALPIVLGIIGALVFVSFVIATVGFSRDVLRGRYP